MTHFQSNILSVNNAFLPKRSEMMTIADERQVSNMIFIPVNLTLHTYIWILLLIPLIQNMLATTSVSYGKLLN